MPLPAILRQDRFDGVGGNLLELSVDAARAKAQAEQKRQALESGIKRDSVDYARIEAGLLKELARLKVAEKGKRP